MFELIDQGKMSVIQFRAIAAGVLGDAYTPSRARINSAYNRTEPFGLKDEAVRQHLEQVMRDLVKLQREFPVPINFSEHEVIARLIKERRDNNVPVFVYLIRISRTAFFQKLRNGDLVTCYSETQAATFADLETAQQCNDRLRRMNITGFVDRFTNTWKQDSIITDISDLGL